ncbi:MAG: GNAT family N-acetyltransferase [Nanoarchaeota archaeon]|nr:GNAT family N-acetyltransferase [Nanoarchaeota archaeon]
MENKLKILKINEADIIQSLLDKCEKNDVFLSIDYLKLFSNYLGYEAIYVFYGNEKNYILVPYLKRLIQEFNLKYYDLISPWYYGGPVYFSEDESNLNKLFNEFIGVFSEYCQNNNIVTEFQRFHPLLKNYQLYGNNSNVFFDRKIVYLDLKKDLETLKKEYTRHTRKNINKALSNNLKVNSVETKESIHKFINMYIKSMKNKNARDFYHFNETFFSLFFENFKGKLKIFNVEYKGEVICSSVELGDYGILHDYLRGANPESLLKRPNDILINEIIHWAKERGYKYFMLGGGSSSDENDGIFRFKKSFSSTTADFYIYKKIHNLNKYQELCKQNKKDIKTLSFEKANYFPEYFQMK